MNCALLQKGISWCKLGLKKKPKNTERRCPRQGFSCNRGRVRCQRLWVVRL